MQLESGRASTGGAHINSKIAKELRRYAREMLESGRESRKLMAKPVRRADGKPSIIAVNHSMSERGIYRQLCAAVEKNPEMLEQLRATAAYKKMLDHEQKSGGPTFVQP